MVEENNTDPRLEGLEQSVSRIEQQLAALVDIKKDIQGIKDRFDKIDLEMSLHRSYLEFLRSTQAGGTIPKAVRKIDGGHGLTEPKSAWRRERPYRR